MIFLLREFMVWAIKWILATVFFLTGSVFLLLISIIKPMDPRIALMWAQHVPPFCLKFLGVKLEIRHHDIVAKSHPAVLVANHQHGLDLFTTAQVLKAPTVA